jgi:hypothetical protein
MCRAASEMDTPTSQLNEEKHVKRLQPGSFHGEEVTSEQLVPIMTQEGTPTAALLSAIRRSWYMSAFQYISDRRAPDFIAELEQFALQLAWRRRSPRLDSLEQVVAAAFEVQDQ